MGKTMIAAVAALAALSALHASAASAQPRAADTVSEGNTTYCSKLSEADHQNSTGAPLRDAAAILQQDRANYHRFGLRDYGDQIDPIFGDKDMRARIPALLAASGTSPDVLTAIVEDTPDVCVTVTAKAMAVTLATAAVERPVAAEGRYPFEGRWDCEVAEFAFTPDTYHNGSDTLPIQEIQEGSDGSYTLFFDDGYLITLSGFTGDAMGWFSHASGDDFQCRRLR